MELVLTGDIAGLLYLKFQHRSVDMWSGYLLKQKFGLSPKKKLKTSKRNQDTAKHSEYKTGTCRNFMLLHRDFPSVSVCCSSIIQCLLESNIFDHLCSLEVIRNQWFGNLLGTKHAKYLFSVEQERFWEIFLTYASNFLLHPMGPRNSLNSEKRFQSYNKHIRGADFKCFYKSFWALIAPNTPGFLGVDQ